MGGCPETNPIERMGLGIPPFPQVSWQHACSPCSVQVSVAGGVQYKGLPYPLPQFTFRTLHGWVDLEEGGDLRTHRGTSGFTRGHQSLAFASLCCRYQPRVRAEKHKHQSGHRKVMKDLPREDLGWKGLPGKGESEF